MLGGWLSSTNHKVVGYMYLITSFGFFILAGTMAIIIRLQLFEPENHIVSDQVYNELFTIRAPGSTRRRAGMGLVGQSSCDRRHRGSWRLTSSPPISSTARRCMSWQ